MRNSFSWFQCGGRVSVLRNTGTGFSLHFLPLYTKTCPRTQLQNIFRTQARKLDLVKNSTQMTGNYRNISLPNTSHPLPPAPGTAPEHQIAQADPTHNQDRMPQEALTSIPTAHHFNQNWLFILRALFITHLIVLHSLVLLVCVWTLYFMTSWFWQDRFLLSFSKTALWIWKYWWSLNSLLLPRAFSLVSCRQSQSSTIYFCFLLEQSAIMRAISPGDQWSILIRIVIFWISHKATQAVMGPTHDDCLVPLLFCLSSVPKLWNCSHTYFDTNSHVFDRPTEIKAVLTGI